jgi:predicted membrane protein
LQGFCRADYIEQLLNRIGMVAIRQIIMKCFIDTLAKGVGIICLSITALIASLVWYTEGTRPAFVLAGAFCGVFSILLFYEFCCDMYREYDEELEFVGEADDEQEL